MASPVPSVKSNLQHSIQYRLHPKRKWEVVQEFGDMGGGINGGIAKVRTNDDPLNRFFIEKRFTQADVFYRSAHKEISMLHQVGDHPYITRMYDHFVDEKAKRSSVYMEFCTMGSLADVSMKIQNGQRLNEHKLWLWFIQTMEALVYCHRGPQPENDKAVANWARIYHRDIKPANILLTHVEVRGEKQLVTKIADFGGAQSDEWTVQTKSQAAASHASTTTPGFDPPEYPRFSGASDIWQMALVFLCLSGLAGCPPKSTMNKHGRQWDVNQPAGPNYSQELSSVLKWCLNKDAKARPRSFEVLKKLKENYNTVKSRLPPDPNPTEIFSQAGAQALPPPPAYQSGNVQPQQRPAPPRQMNSDPEAGQMGRAPNNYVGFVSSQRSPQGGAFPSESFFGSSTNPYYDLFYDDDYFGYWDDEDYDRTLPGGFYSTSGYSTWNYPPGYGPPSFGPPDFGRRF